MPYYNFEPEDIFHNEIVTHPKFHFFIYKGKCYINQRNEITGAFVSTVPHVSAGYVSLYELNVDRDESAHTWDADVDSDGDGINEGAGTKSMIFPFMTKAGTRTSFDTVTATEFNTDFSYGDMITGSYPLSSSLQREYYQSGTDRARIDALKNVLNHYKAISPHYQYNSSLGNKATQEMSLISVPSIFYGSTIERGSVNLKYYITGTLVAQLNDYNKNGDLIEIGPEGSNGTGSVAGTILYNEGFILLTGSWAVENDTSITRDYLDDASNKVKSKWIYFGTGIVGDGKTGTAAPSSSFSLEFNGTNYIPTVTMFAHAPIGELNWSNNPTFFVKGQATTPATSSIGYTEPENLLLKNIVTSSYSGPAEDYHRTTYITKIGIFDEDKKLIGIANIANPVKKTEEQEYTFKLKLDF
jgi:hypothetical protein